VPVHLLNRRLTEWVKRSKIERYIEAAEAKRSTSFALLFGYLVQVQ